jgi:cytochrome P450 PksS
MARSLTNAEQSRHPQASRQSPTGSPLVDFTAHDVHKDPYARYKQLRDNDPIGRLSQGIATGSYFLTRYEDVSSALRDRRFANDRRNVGNVAAGGAGGMGSNSERDLSQARWMPSTFRALLNSMVMVDDPDHRRLRDLVHKAFTPRMVESMAPRIERISNRLLDRLAAKPGPVVDLVRSFALPLPLIVISDMMGVPPGQRSRFHKWSVQFIDSASGSRREMLMNIPAAMANAFAMQRFFKKLIELRRRQPADDLITALVAAEEGGDKLSEDELVAMLFLLLLAGHETTVNLIGNGTLALLQHPDQLQKLRENKDDPGLMESAVEELLRFTNPVHMIAPRYALEDIELHGQTIPRGSTVMLGIAAANWDDRVFANPERLDITRRPNKHVAFGAGIHFCLGAPLARLEARIAFRVLLERFPHLRLAVRPEQVQWRSSVALRGLKSLPVRLV